MGEAEAVRRRPTRRLSAEDEAALLDLYQRVSFRGRVRAVDPCLAAGRHVPNLDPAYNCDTHRSPDGRRLRGHR